MPVVDHPRSTSNTTGPASELTVDGQPGDSGPTTSSSPLERGTKAAVQASLRYHGRLSMGTVRSR